MNRIKLLFVAFLAVCSVSFVAMPATVSAGNSVQVCGAHTTGKCQDFVEKYINPVVTLLTVIIGVIAAISIVVAGIQYASAGSDPGKVQKAKDRIGQTLLGLVAYILLFSFLNYLIPGGLF